MKKSNKQHATMTDLNIKKVSTSKKGIGMYTITFKVAGKPVSQTRHMTEAQAVVYEPRVEVVQSGGRTLQKSSFKVK